jgi:hypothetical protein
MEREATLSKLPDMARYLQETLGQQVTAYVCGLKDPKMVGHWAQGTKPRPPADLRLRQAYEAVRLIAGIYDPETAKSWLFGCNSQLGNEAPAFVLRYAESFDAMREIVPIARGFVAGAF